MKRDLIRQTLKRYLKGTETTTERQTVDHWYQQLDKEDPINLTNPEEKEIKEEIWSKIHTTLHPNPVLKKTNHVWKYAAACLALLLFTGLLWTYLQQATPSGTIRNKQLLLSTKPGERKTIRLKDQSLLILNGGSSIRIASDFIQHRFIEITDGEVYFEVKHDPQRPFIIKSGQLSTAVLGTSFNIKAFRALKKIEIAVTSGKVGVSMKNQPAHLLKKGQQLLFDEAHQSLSTKTFDDRAIRWGTGQMVLDDVDFNELVTLFHKHYNLLIQTNDPSIQKKHFTATLKASMPPAKALEVLLSIHQLKSKQRRNYVEIYR